MEISIINTCGYNKLKLFLSIAFLLIIIPECFSDPYFQSSIDYSSVVPKIMGSESIFGDIDGDGLKDLVTYSTQSHQLVWFKNNNGILGEENIIGDYLTSMRNISIFDIDDDGDNDIVHTTNIWVKLYKNNGFGNFTDSVISFSDLMGQAITVGDDFNNDGVTDLCCSGNYMLFLWRATVNDTFNIVQIQDTVNYIAYSNKSAYDVDLDGDKDLFVMTEARNSFGWLEFDSALMSFTNYHPVLPDAESNDFIGFFDFNED